MLTKDLVRFRIRKGRAYPQFLDCDDSELQGFCSNLIDVFESGLGTTRAELLESSDTVVQGVMSDTAIARGMEKLLLDRSLFEENDDVDLPTFRHEVFTHAFKELEEQAHEDPQDYLKSFEPVFDMSAAELQKRLYGDLPDLHLLTEFRSIEPKALINRYNVSLIQWLLLSAEQVKVSLTKPTTGALRKLYKALRFHQLIARVVEQNQTQIQLVIDGPSSLFFQTKKYGMNLARFFPILLTYDAWHIESQIHPSKKKACTLNLDQDSGLQPIYQHFHGYIPKEVLGLQDRFAKEDTAWSLKANEENLALPGEFGCFPDFYLSADGCDPFYLELFHQWHQSHLLKRIEQLERPHKARLLIGVDRRLYKKDDIKKRLDQSAYFAKWGFLYSDLPTSGQVLKAVKRVLDA